MPYKIGFDNEKYLEEQTHAILHRVGQFDNKLYLEFGGKIILDHHAARVLPGFDPNVKIRLFQKLKDNANIIFCIYAGDIERRKIRADFGLTYDLAALKTIDDFRAWGIEVSAVVITRFEQQLSAQIFKNKLERREMKVYTHTSIKGYPHHIDMIVSDEGYGVNEYIETTKPLVIVTGPGPGSGKLATCLSQMYHDHKRGIKSGYAKFETFPIWNLPVTHPVNIAYEAATADIRDFNLIDPFHLEAYGTSAVNYNRDVEVFPVLKRILEKISGREAMYKSPTDMGVNRAGFGICNDTHIQEASKQEIICRFFNYACEYAKGLVDKETVHRVELLLQTLHLTPEDRHVVKPAREAALEAQQTNKGHEGIFCGAALELPNGTIVTGKNSALMHATSALILNAIKVAADIPDKIHLLAPSVLDSIRELKQTISENAKVSLDLDETLIALSVSAAGNPAAKLAIEQLRDLKGCQMHITHILLPGDEAGLRRLGINFTCDPNFSSKSLFLS